MRHMHEHKEAVTGQLNKPWPVLPWLQGYGSKTFRLDLVAGLTAAGRLPITGGLKNETKT